MAQFVCKHINNQGSKPRQYNRSIATAVVVVDVDVDVAGVVVDAVFTSNHSFESAIFSTSRFRTVVSDLERYQFHGHKLLKKGSKSLLYIAE